MAFAEKNPSFSDVPSTHHVFEAVEYLKERGLIEGYADGTFQPGKKVNRAEALQLIARPLMTDAERKASVSSPFTDVPSDAWFTASVEWARKKGGIIEGPPAKVNFLPGRNVTKAEFIKMLLQSRGVDPKSFGDITLPFSKDVSSTKDWFYPYMRYAIAGSMTAASNDGMYSPNREITRADAAHFLYRFLTYKLGQRTQALLSETERELSKTIDALAAHNVTGAEYTSARALLMMRGALEAQKNEPVVKAVVKVTEGYRSLVRAFRAADKNDWKTVVKLASDAWYLGDQALKAEPRAKVLATQLQQYAKSFADQARAKL